MTNRSHSYFSENWLAKVGCQLQIKSVDLRLQTLYHKCYLAKKLLYTPKEFIIIIKIEAMITGALLDSSHRVMLLAGLLFMENLYWCVWPVGGMTNF